MSIWMLRQACNNCESPLRHRLHGGQVKTNYVLIDYENVQPAAMEVLNQAHFKVIVFVGANQTKVTYDIASTLQSMEDRAGYIKISGNGSNALDFHIAFYIGQLAAQDPESYFHIVSKDAGFDPLIQHLKSKKILACRSRDIADIPAIKAANSKSPEEKLAIIISDLKRRGASKPRTVKTLSSTINSMFQKQLPEAELTALLKELQRQEILVFTGSKVSYTLPT